MSIRRDRLPTAAPSKWRSSRPRSVARKLGRSASILVAAVPLLGAPQARGCGGGGDPSPAVGLETEEGLRRASDRTIAETMIRALRAIQAGAPIDRENYDKIRSEIQRRPALQGLISNSVSRIFLDGDDPSSTEHLFSGELLPPYVPASPASGTPTVAPPTAAAPPVATTPPTASTPPPAAGGSPAPATPGAPATTWTIGPSVSYKPATPTLLTPPTAATPTPNASDCRQPTCADEEARQRQVRKAETKRAQADGRELLLRLGVIR